MSEQVQRRLVRNEGVCREVNEAILRGQWPGEAGSPIGFRCECARLGCNLLVTLTLGEYQTVRSSGRRFMVAPGHQAPGSERIVADGGSYLVVEKLGEAGEHAEARDPRDA